MAIGAGMLVSLLETTDKITQAFVFEGYAHLVNVYRPTIFALVGLSLTTFGYAIMQGWVPLNFAELSKRVLLIGFCIALALHWDFFAAFIYNTLMKVPNTIALHVVQSVPESHYAQATSIQSGLQQAFYDGIAFGQNAWDHGDWTNVLPRLWAVLIWLVTYCFSGMALLELITAKLGLAILLVLSPIIFPTLLFPAAKAMLFTNWTRHLLGFALVPIFVMSAITLALMLISQSVNDLESAIAANQLTLTPLVAYLLCSIVNIGLITKSAHLAVSLAAGFSMGINGSAGYMTRRTLVHVGGALKGFGGRAHHGLKSRFNRSNFSDEGKR
jgi:type IV secretory pathway VirB6-like protein